MKIYLAGPDVFFPEAKEHGDDLKRLCKEHGHEGLFPLDNEIEVSDLSKSIYLANKNMIDICDVVLANLMDWRGPEPDAGTVWECGYAIGRGKSVYGYGVYGEYKTRVIPDKYSIEDFGNPVNLMLSESITVIEGGFLDALSLVK